MGSFHTHSHRTRFESWTLNKYIVHMNMDTSQSSPLRPQDTAYITEMTLTSLTGKFDLFEKDKQWGHWLILKQDDYWYVVREPLGLSFRYMSLLYSSPRLLPPCIALLLSRPHLFQLTLKNGNNGRTWKAKPPFWCTYSHVYWKSHAHHGFWPFVKPIIYFVLYYIIIYSIFCRWKRTLMSVNREVL